MRLRFYLDESETPFFVANAERNSKSICNS